MFEDEKVLQSYASAGPWMQFFAWLPVVFFGLLTFGVVYRALDGWRTVVIIPILPLIFSSSVVILMYRAKYLVWKRNRKD